VLGCFFALSFLSARWAVALMACTFLAGLVLSLQYRTAMIRRDGLGRYIGNSLRPWSYSAGRDLTPRQLPALWLLTLGLVLSGIAVAIHWKDIDTLMAPR
jgi:hypothetical protein